MATARDWQPKVEIVKKLKCPPYIAVTETSGLVAMLELTVSWEDLLEEASERKKTSTRSECQRKGWKT